MRPAPALSRRRLFQAAATTSVVMGVSGIAAPRAEAAPVYSSFSPKLPLVTTPEWHLARRAAHAPTAAMAAKIKSMGADAWVDWQLKPASVPDSACDSLVAKHLPWLKMTTAQLKSATGGKPWKGAPLVVRAAALPTRPPSLWPRCGAEANRTSRGATAARTAGCR